MTLITSAWESWSIRLTVHSWFDIMKGEQHENKRGTSIRGNDRHGAVYLYTLLGGNRGCISYFLEMVARVKWPQIIYFTLADKLFKTINLLQGTYLLRKHHYRSICNTNGER